MAFLAGLSAGKMWGLFSLAQVSLARVSLLQVCLPAVS